MEVVAGAGRLAEVQGTRRDYPDYLIQTLVGQKTRLIVGKLTGYKRDRGRDTPVLPTKKPCIKSDETLVALNEYLSASTCIRTWGTVAELAVQLGDYLAIWAIERSESFDISQYFPRSLKPLSVHLGPLIGKSGLEAVVAAHCHL